MLFNPIHFMNLEDRLSLKAALGASEDFPKTYAAWRSEVCIDEISTATYGLLPAIAQRAIDIAFIDRELPRMRGIVRHTWLSNQVRARALVQALLTLAAANIDTMILKGAALFARYPQMTIMRAPGDFDVLVRRRDVLQAIRMFQSAGYRFEGPRLDLFQRSDFDLIHGGHLVKSRHEGAVDLHWRPLPSLNSERLVEEIFARSEIATLSGHEVRVPSLADHLALTVSRAETWDGGEFAQRTAEAALLLKACEGALDWSVFFRQISLLHCRNTAWHMLEFINDQLAIRIPTTVLAKVGGWRAVSAVQKCKAPIAQAIVGSVALSAQNWGRLALRRLHRARARRRRFVVKGHDRALEKAWAGAVTTSAQYPTDKISFLSGFSVPESEGRWTNGRLAVLHIPVDAAHQTIDVRITAHPFIPSEVPAFVFNVSAGPGTTQHYRLDGMTPAAFTVEKALVLEARRVVLALRLPDATSPALYDMSIDSRELGLFFRRIEILSQGALLDRFEFGES